MILYFMIQDEENQVFLELYKITIKYGWNQWKNQVELSALDSVWVKQLRILLFDVIYKIRNYKTINDKL